MSTIERAIEIAATAHAGQKGKNGEAYILHPLRVMMAVGSESERMAAVLHDVVEDTSVTLDDLRAAGFAEEVVRAVDLLTKREGESREEAARRAVADPIARAVKLADVSDNMDLTRLPRITKKDRDRLAEYEKVKAILEAGPVDEAAGPVDEPAVPSEAAVPDATAKPDEAVGEGSHPAGMDPRHPRIRINYTYGFIDAARRLAYKYTDLGAVVTLFEDRSQDRFAFRGRLCYYNSDPVTVSIAERLARDVSTVAKIEARFVAFPQRDTDFVIYLIERSAKRKKKAVAVAEPKPAAELVQCPQCSNQILKHRLARHVNKVHKVSDPKMAEPVTTSSSVTDPLSDLAAPMEEGEGTS